MSEQMENVLNRTGRDYPSRELNECPYPYFDRAREQDPVYQDPDNGSFLVFRHDDIQFVLRNHERFTMNQLPDGLKYGSTRSLGHSDPPHHTETRKFLSRPLTPSRLRGYEPLVHDYSDMLIDRFVADGSVEFVEAFAYPLPTLVISRLLGLPTEGETWDVLQRFSNLLGGGDGPVGDMTIARMHEHIRSWVQERYDAGADDVLGELVQAQVRRDGHFDAEYLVTVTSELIGGSVITTGQMIASAMMLLLQHPEQMAKVQADATLIPAAMEETLRYESPVQWHPRHANQDVDLPSGQRIPAGSHVMLVYASGNRDPHRFTEPEEFSVERSRRELKAHFGFGYGLHFCLGAPLARLEGVIAFEHLFARLANLRLSARNDFRHIDNLHFRAVRELHLEFDPA